MSTGDAGLDLLLAPERLSRLVGRPVRVQRVRPKPGGASSAVLVLEEGPVWGWVQSLTGTARAKIDKVLLRAVEHGHRKQVGVAADAVRGSLLVWGPMVADPRLSPELDRLVGRGAIGPGVLSGELASSAAGGRVSVLRYNPLRRLVMRHGGDVIRVTAHHHRTRLTRLTSELAERGVPVVTAMTARRVHRSREQVSFWPWIEGTDATAELTGVQAEAVGRALAVLHTVPGDELTDLQVSGWTAARTAAEATVRQLEKVAPEHAHGARRAVDRLPDELPTGPALVAHGDFSLDQCLIGADGRVLLTDFDRAGLAPAVHDLATLRAVAAIEGHAPAVVDTVERAYLDELSARGASAPVIDRRDVWVAAMLLARASEPWRAQSTDWPAEVSRRVELAVAHLG